MKFEKWQGIGNDFILLNCIENKIENPGALAKKMCNRHYGVGADGLILIERSQTANFRMRVVNSDGSEPEMCGNGLRCAAKYIKDNDLISKNKFTVETLAGIKEPEIMENSLVRVNMGTPVFAPALIPLKTNILSSENIIISDIVPGKVFTGTAVSMGNPHFVIFTDDISDAVLYCAGPKIETHSFFPKKTNVEFIKVLDTENIRMRVWERGAGVTMACGTGACASAVAAIKKAKTKNNITVQLDGGNLEIEWAGTNDSPVFMTGSALKTFDGFFDEKEVNYNGKT